MFNFTTNDYLQELNVPLLWKNEFTGKNINIAVVEDVIINIPNKLNIKGWFDTRTNQYSETAPSVDKQNNHGYSSASLIGGADTGIAPECNIYNVIVNTDVADIKTLLSNVKKALKWCISNNIDIINMSLDIPEVDNELILLAKEACAKNITIVCSLGNSSIENNNLFLCSDYVISVGAVDKNKNLCDFSNYGSCMNFVSFGDAVPAYDSNGQIIEFNGTSCAAPLISGLIALYKQQNKFLSHKEIEYLLLDNSENIIINKNDKIIICYLAKAALIPCNYKKDQEIKMLEEKMTIEEFSINCSTTILEGETISPIISITPKTLNNQDIYLSSSDDTLTDINHITNSIKMLSTGNPVIDFWIPKRNVHKKLTFNVLSTLEYELKKILGLYNVPEVNNKGFNGKNIKIALIDSGVNKVGNIDNVIYGPNYIAYQPTSSVLDTYGHGTVTASLIKFIAPKCIIYSIKNQSNAGYSYTNETLQLNSLQWCIDNKMDIVVANNLLLGSYSSKNKLFKKMNDSNIITIVNQLTGDANKSSSPDTNVLCVGFFNTPKIDLLGYLDVTCYNTAIPVYDVNGNFVLSTKLNFSTNLGIISGICALLKQQSPSLNVTSLKSLLPSICENMGEFRYFGYGIMKAHLI